eukprot:1381501-Amorphochlora_amoeboformis.AAC.1
MRGKRREGGERKGRDWAEKEERERRGRGEREKVEFVPEAGVPSVVFDSPESITVSRSDAVQVYRYGSGIGFRFGFCVRG